MHCVFSIEEVAFNIQTRLDIGLFIQEFGTTSAKKNQRKRTDPL